MLFHRALLSRLVGDRRIEAWVDPPDSHMCEDQAVVAVATNATGLLPLVVLEVRPQ